MTSTDISTLVKSTIEPRQPGIHPKVGVSAVSSPLEVGASRAHEAAKNLSKVLERAGCEVVALDSISNPDQAVSVGKRMAESRVDVVAIAASSWFEDYLILDLLEECACPLLMWSIPGMETGALCGTQQLTSFLKYLDRPYRCVYGAMGDDKCLSRAMAFIRAATLKNRLRRSRIGMAGSRLNGMTHTAPNEFALKKSLGSRVIQLDLADIIAQAKRTSKEEAQSLWEHILSNVGACHVNDADGLYSMQMYLALEEVIEKYGLNALAVGCYYKLMGSVCLPASLLADRGIPLACEGDVNGAVGQLILTLLTNQPTHNTDWLEPLEDGSLILTHCGSGSFSLAEDKKDVILAPVRLTDQGVCALFTTKPGPITLLNLTPGDSGYLCSILEGEALRTEMVFPGNPVRVRFSHPVEELIEWIHDCGISHHWMIGCGHVAAEIRELTALAGPSLKLLDL